SERALDQRIQRWRPEQVPPLLRNIAALDEMLRPSGLRIGRGGLRRELLFGVAPGVGRSRVHEIRSDRAPRQQHSRKAADAYIKPSGRALEHWYGCATRSTQLGDTPVEPRSISHY